MRPIGRYWPTKEKLLIIRCFFQPISFKMLVDETGRSPIEKLLSWCVLTGVGVSRRRPERKKNKYFSLALSLWPVPPGWASSRVEAELPHPVHGGDGVIPAVPPPPGQDGSHPGCLEAVQDLHVHLGRKYRTSYSVRGMFVVRETTELCVEKCWLKYWVLLTLLSVIQGWDKHSAAVRRF